MLRSLARIPTFRSLVHRNWRVLWLAGHLWHLAFWMDLIVLGWLVLELTNSPLAVALVGAFRLIPMAVLGPVAGSFGDRLPRKRMLLFAQAVNLTVTIGFTLVLLLGREQVWLVYAAALLTGSAWAIDFPVRRAFIRDMLPARSIVNAMALDAASLTGMTMVGRWLAGGFLALTNPTAAYAFLALCYVVGLFMLLRVPDPSARRARPESQGSAAAAVATDLAAGLAYVWRSPVLRNILLVTIVINLMVAPYFQLTPVFAKEVYGVGPGLLGLLSGMDGLGSLIGTIFLAGAVGLKRLGRVFVGGSILFAALVAVFSQAPTHLIAMPLLVMVGVGVAGFATMQTTISVVHASPEMRGRAMGAVALGIGGLPVGMAFVGALAEAFGAPRALGISSLAALGLILLIAVVQPALRRAQ